MTDTDPITSATFPRLYVPPADDDAAAFRYAAPVYARADGSDLPPVTVFTSTVDPMFTTRYLVTLTGAFVEVPVGLFDYREEAVEFARRARTDPDTCAAVFYDAAQQPPHERCTDWDAVSVTEFSGPVPMCRTVLFEFPAPDIAS